MKTRKRYYYFLDQAAGRLLKISDFNNNFLSLEWDNEGRLEYVEDSTGEKYYFHYDQQHVHRLEKLTFKEWEVLFQYDEQGRLSHKSILNHSGTYAYVNTKWTFEYYHDPDNAEPQPTGTLYMESSKVTYTPATLDKLPFLVRITVSSSGNCRW